MDAARQIIAKEGVKSLFKGAAANILRGVAGAGVLSIYDQLQVIMFGKKFKVRFPICCTYSTCADPLLVSDSPPKIRARTPRQPHFGVAARPHASEDCGHQTRRDIEQDGCCRSDGLSCATVPDESIRNVPGCLLRNVLQSIVLN